MFGPRRAAYSGRARQPGADRVSAGIAARGAKQGGARRSLVTGRKRGQMTETTERPNVDLQPKAPRAEWDAWAFRAAVVLFASFAVVQLCRPLVGLLAVVADDAFYYLGIA